MKPKRLQYSPAKDKEWITEEIGLRLRVWTYKGDYLNFVGKNKKVPDFSLKLGVTHWGITFFVIKKF